MSLEEKEKELYGMAAQKAEDAVDLRKKEISQEDGGEQFENAWGDNAAKITDFPESVASKVVRKASFYGKISFWLIVFVALAGVGFTYYFLNQYSKSKDLNFDVEAPSKVMVARPFEITIDLDNKSQNTLGQGQIMIKLPDGMISLDNNNPDMMLVSDGVGDLNPNGTAQKTYKLVILKDEQSIKKLDITFSYVPQNLNTRFEKEKTIEILADQPAVSLNLTTPQKVFNGETFEMGAAYQNISDYNFENLRLQMVYPQNFSYKDSSPTSTLSNNSWSLGSLASGSGEKDISIKGALSGVDQSFSEIKAQLYATFGQKEYLINEKSASLSIAASPLSLSLLANGDANYAASYNDSLRYQVFYKNNTDVGLNDVVIKVKLSGEMFDFSSLHTNGSFDSVSNTITWNASNISDLKLLQQNAQGEVDFDIKTKATYPIRRISDKNYTLKASGEIDSPTVPYNVSSDKTVGLANLETKVKGYAEISATLQRVKGLYPMQVNKSTDFNVKILIKNYATDIKDVSVKTNLLSGVKWLNVVKSNTDTIPSYNDRTGEIIWQIPQIPATKGVISTPVEADFQIEVTPNITQLNQLVSVMAGLNLTATDAFTNLPMESRTEILRVDSNVVN